MNLTTEQIENLIDTLNQCKEQIKEKKDRHEEIKVESYACGRDEEGDLHDELEFECSTILANIETCLKHLQ